VMRRAAVALALLTLGSGCRGEDWVAVPLTGIEGLELATFAESRGDVWAFVTQPDCIVRSMVLKPVARTWEVRSRIQIPRCDSIVRLHASRSSVRRAHVVLLTRTGTATYIGLVTAEQNTARLRTVAMASSSVVDGLSVRADDTVVEALIAYRADHTCNAQLHVIPVSENDEPHTIRVPDEIACRPNFIVDRPQTRVAGLQVGESGYSESTWSSTSGWSAPRKLSAPPRDRREDEWADWQLSTHSVAGRSVAVWLRQEYHRPDGSAHVVAQIVGDGHEKWRAIDLASWPRASVPGNLSVSCRDRTCLVTWEAVAAGDDTCAFFEVDAEGGLAITGSCPRRPRIHSSSFASLATGEVVQLNLLDQPRKVVALVLRR
jgi:hypothetical protein